MYLVMRSSKKIFIMCQNKLVQQVCALSKVQSKQRPECKKKIHSHHSQVISLKFSFSLQMDDSQNLKKKKLVEKGRHKEKHPKKNDAILT